MSETESEIRVLVCDDNDAMRTLLEVVVSTTPGMVVVGQAVDGNDAVEQAARLQPDVILLDLAMPQLSGLEALPDLRRIAPAADVIVFSGFPKASVAAEVLVLGARAYLEKGSHPDAIVAAILAARAGSAQEEASA